MLGKPVIKGTRIPVELIIRKLGEGAAFEDLLDAYPNLKKVLVDNHGLELLINFVVLEPGRARIRKI